MGRLGARTVFLLLWSACCACADDWQEALRLQVGLDRLGYSPGVLPPPPASSSGSPREPQYEPFYDDLPWEEPTFEDGRPLDDGEPTVDDRPLDDGPMGDTA